MPLGIGVLLLVVLAAIGGGIAAASKKREPEPSPPPPGPTPPPFQPAAPPEPAKLPATPAAPRRPAVSPAAAQQAAGMKRLAKLVAALGPEPAIGKIIEAGQLADDLGATETQSILKDRLKVAVERVQQAERLKAATPATAPEGAGPADFAAFAK